MEKIQAFVSEQIKTDVPKFGIGDGVKVYVKIVEGEKERTQMFEGTVIARHGGGISETFTVRRVSYGVGVEKTFPLHSPNVEKVVVFREAKVRRAKLYYLRDRVGKAAKVKEKVNYFVSSQYKKQSASSLCFLFLFYTMFSPSFLPPKTWK